MKIMMVFGTRPEAIKMCPLVKYLKEKKGVELKICVTGQHREMLDSVLNIFDIIPDYDLNLMKKGQTISNITIGVLKGVEKIIKNESPDIILVHGDTTTTLASAIAGFYNKIPIAHIEAGLRSGNLYSPYPEEFNRKLIDSFSTFHFCPTEQNKNNLLKEGVLEKNIFVTGNTVIDALKSVLNKEYEFKDEILKNIDYKNKKIILLTIHRRENWGQPMEEIFQGIKESISKHEDAIIIFPMHENPLIKECAQKNLGGIERIYLINSLDYISFSNLMNKCYFVVTDSGGIQEEAPALGKPVVVLREETERLEGVEAGTVKICGISKEKIIQCLDELLENEDIYLKMNKSINPYGVGGSSKMIGDILINYGK